ncbi:MAG: site-specific integrase [Chloroflexi bacterium]|nr:site-specific integrase [Chloroflexota bacterium]
MVDSQARTHFYRVRNRAMLMVLLDGALRVGELMGARRDLLREDGSLTVVGKGGKEREVALAAETVSQVNDYLDIRTDSSQFLFASKDGKPISYYAIKSLFHRLRKANPEAFSGVRLSAHTLRHTSATLRRIVGMSEGDLQTFLGHSNPEMTRHYSVMALENAAKESARRTSPMRDLMGV